MPDDPAARLAAELKRRAIARLTPMERSVRLSQLKDEAELHPQRADEIEAQIEEIENE